MAVKRNALKDAVEKQSQSLEPAQREFVMAEFGTYEWNAGQIAALEKKLKSCEQMQERDFRYESALFKQRHQLVAEQSQLFSHIMRWLKGTSAEIDELEEFLAG
jgi:hypothetical protein